jgi:hypothetical protein
MARRYFSQRASRAARKFPRDGHTDDEPKGHDDQPTFVLVPPGQLREISQVLNVPEIEGPVRRQAERAHEERQHGDAADRAAEQLQEPRRGAGRRPLGALPLVRLRDGAANPQDEQRRQHPDQEHGAARKRGEQKRGQSGQHQAQVDAGLEHGGHPRPPAARPGLREKRRADGPFAADAQGGHEPEDEKMPPRLREERQPGKQGVGEDR